MTNDSWRIAPYLVVQDVRVSQRFYCERLGFTCERLWGEPPSYCIVRRSGVAIMLKQASIASAVRPNHASGSSETPWDAYVWVDDADALCAEFVSRGVAIARALYDQPYGCRDFDVEDPNGYRICFGHELESST